MSNHTPKLHWNQRVVLVRHNLHSARRTNDFSFFKSLQAHALIESTDHVALLYSSLGDNADSVLSTLDNLSAGIAYVRQDAFKAVYDAVSVCLNEMSQLEANIDDFIRLEYSWNCIQSSVDAAISTLRGIFSLMAPSNTGPTVVNIPQPSQGLFGRNFSVSSIAGPDHGGVASSRSRNSSTASALSMFKRAFSNAHANPLPQPPAKSARTGSIAMPVPEANPRGFRASMSAACPTKMLTFGEHPHMILTTIPPTPAAEGGVGEGGPLSPFKDSDDYFAFGEMEKSIKGSAAEDLMQM